MKKMNRTKVWILWMVLIYLILISLLVLAESASAEANIRSLPTAVWFTLTTLTTVGYGDTYPVTAAGRLIGALFQIFSTGLLVMLIGMLTAFLRSRFIPMLRLRQTQNYPWYIFTDDFPEAQILAQSIQKEDNNAEIVYCGDAQDVHTADSVNISYNAPELLSQAHGTGKRYVFCLNEDPAENDRKVRELRDTDAEIYVRSEYEPDTLRADIHLFDPYLCCARMYWNKYMTGPEETMLIIGSGKYAEALLEQGLQLNVISPDQHIHYYLYGDYENFRRNHPQLDKICHVNEVFSDRDGIVFCDGSWNQDPERIRTADRIILCDDSEDTNIEILTQLQRYFPGTAQIYARISSAYDKVITFGSAEDIWSVGNVLRTRMNQTAIRLHEIYRQSSGNAPAWEELGRFTRRSNLAAADHLIRKVEILLGKEADHTLSPSQCRKAYEVFAQTTGEQRTTLRRIEHERWARFHYLNNWSYNEKRDNALRHHPLLKKFDQLPLSDQAKDDYGWEVLKDLAG